VKRSTDRILTTFVGSLIRPPALRELLDKRDTPEFADTLRASVAEVVHKQADAGLDVVSDGELSKSNWAGYILDRVTGFELRPTPPGLQTYNRFGREGDEFADFYTQNVVGEWSPRVVVCSGPIGYDDTQIKHDISNFKAALEQVDVAEAFMPVVAPASFIRDAHNEYYPSEEA
jgi:5-methyltetrahydropteroyltriglutamate--homocysteine methyltransferase